jgi:hypothetical protein
MESTRKLMIVVFALLGLSAIAFSQELKPSEQFQAAVAAFQKNATAENAHKLAELYNQLDPPPVVPEAAEFRALKGFAFVKQAADDSAFAKCAAEFQAAVAAAPWVGEYHYNVAVCEKSSGRFSAAQTALTFAQIFARDEKERRDCLALQADLEVAQELAATKKARVEAGQREEEAKANNSPERQFDRLIASLNGARFVGPDVPPPPGEGNPVLRPWMKIDNGSLLFYSEYIFPNGKTTVDSPHTTMLLSGLNPTFTRTELTYEQVSSVKRISDREIEWLYKERFRMANGQFTDWRATAYVFRRH